MASPAPAQLCPAALQTTAAWAQRCQPQRELGPGEPAVPPALPRALAQRGHQRWLWAGRAVPASPGRCPRLSSSPKGSQAPLAPGDHRSPAQKGQGSGMEVLLLSLLSLPGQCCTFPRAPSTGAFVLCTDTGLASVLLRLSLHCAPRKSRYHCAFTPLTEQGVMN